MKTRAFRAAALILSAALLIFAVSCSESGLDIEQIIRFDNGIPVGYDPVNDVFTVKNNDTEKLGLAKGDGTVIAEQQYDSFSFCGDSVIAWEDGACSVFNFTTGEVVLKTDSTVYPVGGSLICRQNGELFGLTDTEGNTVADCVYDAVEYCGDDIFKMVSGDRCSFMNISGEFLCDAIYTDGGVLNGMIAAIDENGKYGALTESGEAFIPFEYDYLGRAGSSMLLAEKDDVFYLLDGDGEAVRDIPYDIATVSGEYIIITENGLYGAIDLSGETVLETKYGGVRYCGEGWFAVSDGAESFLIKSDGTRVDFDGYDNIDSFTNGVALIRSGGLYGCVDKEGKVIIKPEYSVMEFTDNGYIAAMKDERWGLFDSNGKRAAEVKYSGIYRSGDGFYLTIDDRAYFAVGKAD